MPFLDWMVVIKAEIGGVTANRDFNIAAERQQLSEKGCLWKGSAAEPRLYAYFKEAVTQILTNKCFSPL